MIGKIQLTSLFICFLLLSGQLYSQTAKAPAKTQLFFEKVYLHLDREYYFAGEDIWYKAYLLNAQGNQLMPTSNNLYVELIGPDAKINQRQVIRLENGCGKGDFRLGDSIPAGNYKLRAYTNWMLNFGDNFVFEKEISVSVDENIKLKNSLNTAVKPLLSPTSTSPGEIHFFPESGSMIDGVTGIVAFKTEDSKGKAIKVKGSVLSSNGNEISIFESKNMGMGSFTIKPEYGMRYQVKGMYDNGRPFTSVLPEVLPQGFSMHVLSDSIKVTVIISTNETTLNAYKDKQFEIKARHAGIGYFSKKITLSSPVSKIIIPNINLPQGIAWVTLIDDKLRPQCERLVYIDKGADADKIILATNKTVYRSKERTTLRIRTSALHQPVKANLSLAVVDATVPANKGNIISYLNLESELKGTIELPEQYFNPKNPDRSKHLDLLLMTQGWRDFLWKRIKDTTLMISHLNETGFTISGQVKTKTGKPMAGTNVSLFANGARGQKLLGTVTDQTGKYYFDSMNLEGTQSIRLVSADSKGKKTGTLLLDSIYIKPLPVRPYPYLFSESLTLAALRKELAFRAQQMKNFTLSDSIVLKEVKVKGSKIVNLRDDNLMSFGYPDQNFIISEKDNKDYRSLRHYLITNVSGAGPDDDPESNGVVFIAQGKKVQPRFIVDRMEDVYNRLDYYDLAMKDIEKVVVRHLIGAPREQNSFNNTESDVYRSHAIRDAYLIYLTLKPSAFGRGEPSLLNTTVNGYYQGRVFYEPRYTQASTQQDYRTTIYWQPNVTTNANGEAIISYYNADPKSKIRIVVQGVNEKGFAVVGELMYEVK